MKYNCTKTKKEIIIKKLKVLIDYKTLIATVFLIIGYLKSSIFIFLLGSTYFLLYLVIIVQSLLSKQKAISLDFILEEDELIAKIENQQLMFPFSDIKTMKENKHSLIIKMDKKSGTALRRFEIPYDLEGKHIEFIKELKNKYENYRPKKDIKDNQEEYILRFKLNPKQGLIRYMKYSRSVCISIFMSIIYIFFALMLIDIKPFASAILIFLTALLWIRYYIDYRRIKSSEPMICSIGKLDDENIEIKGDAFRSIVKIDKAQLLNINDSEYILSIEGIKKDSFSFAENEIIFGDVDNLIKIIGESYIDIDNGKQPLLPMIFAIISILCIPLVGIFDTPLGASLFILPYF